MAHFSRIRATGMWVFDTPVTTTEFEQFDDHQFKSVNGDGGGFWAPTAAIEIAGQGLTLSGASLLSSPLTVDAAGSIVLDTGTLQAKTGSHITVDAGAVVAWSNTDTHWLTGSIAQWNSGAQLRVYGELQAYNGGLVRLLAGSEQHVENGALLRVQSGGMAQVVNGGELTADFGSTVTLAGATDIAGGGVLTAQAGSTVNVAAAATEEIHGQLRVKSGGVLAVESGATAQVADRLTFSGKGTIVRRTATHGAGDATYGVGATGGGVTGTDVVYISDGAVRTLTVAAAGATVGNRIRFVIDRDGGWAGNAIHLVNDALVNICDLNEGLRTAIDLEFFGGAWHTSVGF